MDREDAKLNYRPGVLGFLGNNRGSFAEVNDFGRVDIHINDTNKDLNFLLLQALRENHQSIGTKPKECFAEEISSISETSTQRPSLNIVVQVVGSRGDVQPFVALGQRLKAEHGHRIRIATHAVFREFIEQNGLEFFNIGGDPAELMAFMVKNPGLVPGQQALKEGQIGLRRKAMMEIMQRAWRSCFEPGLGLDNTGSQAKSTFVADAIIANPPSFAHIHCAERLGVPLHMMFTMPWSPTEKFPHPLSNIKSASTDMKSANFLTYAIVELLTWQGLGDLINSFREITLGLAPLTALSGPGALARLELPYSYCWSPTLVPKPMDWGNNIDVSGFFFLKHSASFSPDPELESFLERGPPPLYIGFGSIVVDEPNLLTRTIFEAVERSGERALVSKGWGGLGSSDLPKPESIFLLGNVPHDWLFSRVSCVVHHGGAGTTAAGIAAGKPTIIVPFFGDQPFWGSMIEKAGAGPKPIPFSELTTDRLVQAIHEARKPVVISKARSMAQNIGNEDGTRNGVEAFHRTIDLSSLRCSILDQHKAVWQLKNTSLKLSPLAASVLIKASELGHADLELLRTQHYEVAKAPNDPFSGGASALIGTIGSFMGGITDIPTEIFSHIRRSVQKENSDEDSQKSLTQQNAEERRTSQELKPLSIQTGIDAGKGAAKAIGAGFRSPMEFTLALSKGFHNAPKLYGDTTVRDHPNVTDLSSGVRAATVGLGQGFFDGISGLFRHPAEGARQKGLGGFAKGIGRAIGGIILKPAAGFWGVPGYLSQGMWQEIRKRITTRSDAEIVAGRVIEGEDASCLISPSEKEMIIRKWKQLQGSNSRARKNAEGLLAGQTTVNDELIRENVSAAVQDASRGRSEENLIVAQAVEAQLSNRSPFCPPPAYEDTVSSICSTSTRGSMYTQHANQVERSNADNEGCIQLRGDSCGVDSDDDENIKKALEMSMQHH